MRYLTHESEDHFWTSHGAQSHPLAPAEAERRTQIKLEQHTAEEFSPTTKVVKFLPDHKMMMTHAQVPNGNTLEPQVSNDVNERSSSLTHMSLSDDGSHGSMEKHDDEEERSSTSSSGSKKSYMRMNDNDIIRAQEHAKRVGYKVSTV